ncbi:hypothetical protein SGLAM104S_04402 [Streptomyces glaucescens]
MPIWASRPAEAVGEAAGLAGQCGSRALPITMAAR